MMMMVRLMIRDHYYIRDIPTCLPVYLQVVPCYSTIIIKQQQSRSRYTCILYLCTDFILEKEKEGRKRARERGTSNIIIISKNNETEHVIIMIITCVIIIFLGTHSPSTMSFTLACFTILLLHTFSPRSSTWHNDTYDMMIQDTMLSSPPVSSVMKKKVFSCKMTREMNLLLQSNSYAKCQ